MIILPLLLSSFSRKKSSSLVSTLVSTVPMLLASQSLSSSSSSSAVVQAFSSTSASTSTSPASAAAAAATNAADAAGTCTFTALDRARQLEMPSRQETLQRDAKFYDFWDSNSDLLETAWAEWQQSDKVALSLPKLDNKLLIHPKLRQVIETVWNDPSVANEKNVKELWQEVAPGVYAVPFWDMEQISIIQQWFDAVANSGIPTRPPYGIVLNRKGFMTDPRSVGYLAAPEFQAWYRDLVDTYVRPLGRLFFPEAILPEDDSESFSFSIQYQGEQGGDRSIRQHTDASTVTFNINLDQEQTWTGSTLIFFDRKTGKQTQVEWKPGYAMMHLGSSAHAALPIESGTRNNLVIWTFGSTGGRGYGNPLTTMNGYYPEEYQLSPEQRWVKPTEPPSTPWNRWSPF